ncbi:hypothetical protein [Streptomyces sp. V3I7]|uniref:hypothetical protein n=1 Tax=Streptomyces sp. V3I7 TaxID=3042278 RepID=UPI002784E480|nr:hypothetical protein [Streptomyces sp. V3I7]MDQ0992783.1 hypothetical protein [Streptomyces sp. V3I7]
MSVEEHDPFEDRIISALHQVGGTFDSHRLGLAARGEERGRTLRRRRAAVVTGAAAVALVGLGGTFALPVLQHQGGAQRSVAADAPARGWAPPGAAGARPVTADEVIGTLKKLLPEGEFSGEEGRGSEEEPQVPYAQVVYDDGKGKAAVSVSVNRVEPGSRETTETTTCPDKTFIPYDACLTEKLADGSALMIVKGYEFPDRRVDTKLWTAELVTPKGQHVTAMEWNAAAEKDAPISRDTPPLSPKQLRSLVSARAWRDAADAIPADPNAPQRDPRPAQGLVPGGSVTSTLTRLLPKGPKVATKGSATDPEFGYVVLDDGKGTSLVQVNVQRDMSDDAKELFDAKAKKLSDGTLVAWHRRPGEKGVKGIVWWTVDTLRTDGRRVVISAFNSGTQHTAATRATPALTMKQLEAIALDPRWFRSGKAQPASSK